MKGDLVLIYIIHHRIESLLHNTGMNPSQPDSFEIEEISFSHWDFSFPDKWTQHAWLATGNIDSDNFNNAFKIFRRNLARIIPRIALIGQAYIEFVQQPFLISKENCPIAFLFYSQERGPVSLSFMEQDLKALKILLRGSKIPDEFFYYWNDAVNTTGYSSKLLLMFSALESFVKDKKGKKNFTKLERILGKPLKKQLWGEPDKSNKEALRHRLIHGEYFQPPDSGIDYVEVIHKKLIRYFNRQIFRETLLSDDIVNPQRHFWGDKEGGKWFIQANGQNDLNLKSVLFDFNEHGIDNLQNYEIVDDDSLQSTF